jgi:hypothetical protein
MTMFSFKPSLGWALGSALTLLATGCFNGKNTEGYPCLDNDQCGKGLVCERGFCGGPPLPPIPWGPCLIEGCAVGEACTTLGDSFLSCGPPCQTAQDCLGYVWDPWTFACANNTCLPQCDLATNACPDGRDCVNVGGQLVCGWWQSSM